MKPASDLQSGSTLEIASQLVNILNKQKPTTPLHSLILEEIDLLAKVPPVAFAARSMELDKQGTRLWNLCCERPSSVDAEPRSQCLVRAFASILLDMAQRCQSQYSSNAIRVFETLSKASRLCLGKKQLDLAAILLEKAAYYNDNLKPSQDVLKSRVLELSNRYAVLRIALAWEQDRLDLGRLMLKRLKTRTDALESGTVWELADLLYEIGKDLMQKALWSEALTWFEDARHFSTTQAAVTSNTDRDNLRLCIHCCIAKCMMVRQDQIDRGAAWTIVEDFSTEFGDKLPVLLLKLELLASEFTGCAQKYCDTITQLTAVAHLTDSNLDIIIHHIHELRKRDSQQAHEVLVKLIHCLFRYDNRAWIEKVLVTTVWNCITCTELPNALENLHKLFDKILEALQSSLSISASQAIQVLLWSPIQTAYTKGHYESAESWCILAMHNVLHGSTNANTPVLERRMILCALGRSDIDKAREIASNMSRSDMNDSYTQYLLYKIAVRSNDTEKAVKSLTILCTRSSESSDLIQGCLLEMQRIGETSQILSALQQILTQVDHCLSKNLNLPALLRYYARLLVREAGSAPSDKETIIEHLCNFFESVVTHARKSLREEGDNLFSILELDWFSRNTYNLALKFCTTWGSDHVLSLCQSCTHFIELYPQDLNVETKDDLSLRLSFNSFLSCSLLINLARQKDDPTQQLRSYQNARIAVQTWREHARLHLDRMEGPASEDLRAKHATLLSYDFEAATRLQAWDSLPPIVDECRCLTNITCLTSSAEIVLGSDAPPDVLIPILRRIIDSVWDHESQDIWSLSRWVRCLFSLALTSKPKVAEELVDRISMSRAPVSARHHEAATMPSDAGVPSQSQGNRMSQYPSDELRFLACVTFNHAMDLYNMSLDDDCQRWAAKAVLIASTMRDDSTLHDDLLQRLDRLTW